MTPTCSDCGKRDRTRAGAEHRASTLTYSGMHESNFGVLENANRRFDAEQGSRLLLQAYARYYLNHVAEQAA